MGSMKDGADEENRLRAAERLAAAVERGGIRMSFEVEERLAWDRYAAAFSSTLPDLDEWTNRQQEALAINAADFADALLEERRKRFGSSVK